MSWVLVTGGARRLGAAICQGLAKEGYSIIVHYRNSKSEALEVVKLCRSYGVEAEAIYGDFSSASSTQLFLDHLLAKFSNVDHLINNVGNYLQTSLQDTSTAQWETLFQENVHAAFACIQALLPQIKQAKGTITNLGVAGVTSARASAPTPVYRITKMTLWMLTRMYARELAPFQVRVNMVSPGQLTISEDQPVNPETLPMHRLGSLDEVVGTIIFLLSPQSNYITGQNIEVAGGLGL